MVTTVGMEGRLDDLLHDLVELDYDAAAAYQSAIARMGNASFREKLSEFRDDHLRHTREVGQCLADLGRPIPQQGDMKQILTKGKVVIASLMGDAAILEAMRTNEDDTVTAYDRASEFKDAPAAVHRVIEGARQDEHRHCAWIRSTLGRLGSPSSGPY